MAKEIVFENGQISNFEGLMTLTLILNWVIMHTIMHHSSTSTYMPNFTEIEELFFLMRLATLSAPNLYPTFYRTDFYREVISSQELFCVFLQECLQVNQQSSLHRCCQYKDETWRIEGRDRSTTTTTFYQLQHQHHCMLPNAYSKILVSKSRSRPSSVL